LRGGANGDEEKWLCNVCGKTLVSKRNLDQHMNSVHVNHPDFTCITSADGLLKWKCCVCNNLLSSKQRIISHLEKSHGKTNLQQANKQTYNSRTTLWRNRKRSADGYFVSEQVCSSPCSSLNISESCPVSDKEPLLVPEGASSTPCFFQSILRETEEQNSGANTSWQNKPHESSTEDGYLENNQNDSFDNLHSNLIINPKVPLMIHTHQTQHVHQLMTRSLTTALLKQNLRPVMNQTVKNLRINLMNKSVMALSRTLAKKKNSAL